MNTGKRYDDTFYWKVVKSWPLIVSLLALIGGYGFLRAQICSMQGKLIDSEQKHKTYETRLSGHDERIARVEEGISQLPEIRADIKSILREMKR